MMVNRRPLRPGPLNSLALRRRKEKRPIHCANSNWDEKKKFSETLPMTL
jgi:hypothetical protein